MGQMGLISPNKEEYKNGLCQTDRGGEQPTMLSCLRKTADERAPHFAHRTHRNTARRPRARHFGNTEFSDDTGR